MSALTGGAGIRPHVRAHICPRAGCGKRLHSHSALSVHIQFTCPVKMRGQMGPGWTDETTPAIHLIKTGQTNA